MGVIRQTIVDWLGNKYESMDVSSAATDDDEITACEWMEVAHSIMASYVADALRMCSINFYTKGKRDKVLDANYLWNVSPNPNQSASDFKGELITRLLYLDGECLVVPVKTGGRTRLYIAESFENTPVPGAASVFSNLVIEGSSQVVPYPMSADDVYYFDASSLAGGWSAMGPKVKKQYDAIADVVFKATADRNGRKWFLNLDQPNTGTPEQAERINTQLRESVMPFVKHTTGVMPLYKGQSLERASLDSGRFSGMNAKDIANVRSDMFSFVAAAFHMPASMLLGNASNFPEVMSSFLTFGVDPVAKALSTEITRKSFTRQEILAGSEAKVDTSSIRHIDLFEAADAIYKLQGSSLDNTNELRGFTGQDPIDEDWADEYVRTKNNEDIGGEVKNE